MSDLNPFQLIGMLAHRLRTLGHIVSTTSIRLNVFKKKKGFDETQFFNKHGVQMIKDLAKTYQVCLPMIRPRPIRYACQWFCQVLPSRHAVQLYGQGLSMPVFGQIFNLLWRKIYCYFRCRKWSNIELLPAISSKYRSREDKQYTLWRRKYKPVSGTKGKLLCDVSIQRPL